MGGSKLFRKSLIYSGTEPGATETPMAQNVLGRRPSGGAETTDPTTPGSNRATRTASSARSTRRSEKRRRGLTFEQCRCVNDWREVPQIHVVF